MKFSKRLLSLFLSVVIIMSMLGMTALAAGGSTNVEFTVDKSTAQPGDTITVTFSNKEMKVAAFTGGVMFDKSKLECTSIVGPDADYPNDFGLTKKSGKNIWVDATAVSTLEQANAAGTVGFAYAGATDVEYAASKLYTATFKVKEAASGDAVFTLYEDTACADSAGTDKFKSDSIETKTVTITGAEPPAAETYTVKFDANGGTGTMADVKVDKAATGDTTYTLPLNKFTEPAGKEFYAWQIGDELFAPGYKITLTGDITAKAVWKTSIASVDFTMSGYELGKTPADIVLNTTNTNVDLGSVGIYTSDTIEDSNKLATGSAFESGKDYYLFVEVTPKDGYIISQNATKANFTLSQSVETRAQRLNYGTVEEVTFKLPQLEAAAHTHSYTENTVKPEALKSAADCMSAAVYYKSCTCGAVSTNDADTFTSGNKDKYNHADSCKVGTDWKTDNTNHWHERTCGAKADEAAHSYTLQALLPEALKSEANCQSAAVYYKSCTCGASANTAETFTYGEIDSTKHIGTLGDWQKDETNHWKEYSGCKHKVSEAAHSYDTDGKCVCGAEKSKLTQTITVADTFNFTYGDEAPAITATAKTALTYTVVTGTDVVTVDATTGALTINKAGTATVKISAAADDTYNSADTTVTVTVAKREMEIESAGCYSRDYEPGNKTVVFGSASFKYIKDYLAKDTDYTGTCVMADDTAGVEKPVTITIELKGIAAERYTLKSNTYETKVSINKIAATVPTGLTGKTGAALSTVALPTGWTWVDGTTTLSKEVSAYKANYAGTDNYNPATNVDLTVTVSDKLTQTITVADVTATYGDTGKKIDATLTTGDGALTYTVTAGTDVVTVDETGALTILKAGTATVTVKAAETAAYAEATKTVTVKVEKADLTVTAKNQSIYVNGTVPTLDKDAYTVTGLVGTDTVDVTLAYQKDGVAVTDPDATTAGSYDIVVTATASDNYNVTTKNATLTITKRSSGGGGGGSSTSSYTITVDKTTNGTITTSAKSAAKGEVITVTVKANNGYELDALTVLDKNSNEIKLTEKSGKYTFTMPASKVTVKGSFVAEKTTEAPEEVKNPFTDVPSGAYYEDAVLWAAEEGITGGTTATTFSSDATCTRAQAVAFLWRAAGCPTPTGKAMPFTDVAVGSYYYDAVLWAIENGITKGTSETTFGPNEGCTRAQIVTFLWRSQNAPASDAANPFVDVSADAYYVDAVLWAVKEDVTKGTTNTTFSPDQDCTRAQIVTFIYRCVK